MALKPESVTYDAMADRLLAGSAAGLGVHWVRAESSGGAAGNATLFSEATVGMQTFGVRMSPDMEVVYVCVAQFPGFSTTSVLALNASTGALIRSANLDALKNPAVASGNIFANDVAVDPATGDLYVSDVMGFQVLRIDGSSFAPSVFSRAPALAPSDVSGYGPDGIVIFGRTLVVSVLSDSRLVTLDLDSPAPVNEAKPVTIVPGPGGPPSRFFSPDGMIGCDGRGIWVVGDSFTAAPSALFLLQSLDDWTTVSLQFATDLDVSCVNGAGVALGPTGVYVSCLDMAGTAAVTTFVGDDVSSYCPPF